MEIVSVQQDENHDIIQQELNSRLYTLDQKIGRGNFADVWKAHHDLSTDHKLTVAIKVIDKKKRTDRDLTKIYREIEILKKLRHPNIIRLYQVFESGNFIFLVTELCGKGELFDLIVDTKLLTEEQARKIFSEILSAVEHAHSHNIVHRDLKTENVLLDDSGNVKLADFGFGQYFETDKMLNTWCGSPPYAAPEVFEGREYEGPELDCWSLGCILYVLVCGKLPFDAPDMAQLKELIVHGRCRIPWFISNECYDLIKKCLTPNSKRRIKLVDIRYHSWMRNLQSIIEPVEPLINTNVLNVMEAAGVDRQKIVDAVQSHAFNGLFALYHLLLDKEKAQLQNFKPRPNQISQYVTQNQYNHSVDQYGFPTMLAPQQQPPNAVILEPNRQAARRHTVNNVLSTISLTQQQSLQQVYHENHIQSQGPFSSSSNQHIHSGYIAHPLAHNLQQCHQNIMPTRIHQYPSQQPQQPPPLKDITQRSIQPQQYIPSLTVYSPTEQRPWRQGRRASDGLINGINPDQVSFYEQINPIQMIQEAEVDYNHTWSSIRHPTTQQPKKRNSRQREQSCLPDVPEEINQLPNLSSSNIDGSHFAMMTDDYYPTQYNSAMARMLRSTIEDGVEHG